MLQLHLWLLFFQLFFSTSSAVLWLNELTATTQNNHSFYLHSKWFVFHSKRLHFASNRGQLQWKSNNNVVTMKINELQEIKCCHGALTRGIFLDSFFNQFYLWTNPICLKRCWIHFFPFAQTPTHQKHSQQIYSTIFNEPCFHLVFH